MYQFLYNGEYHTKTTVPYLKSLGMDDEQIESVQGQEQFELEQEKEKVRKLRDIELGRVIKRVERYQTQLLTPDVDTTDTEETYLGLLTTAQALRDVPQQGGFPYSVVWPESL